MKREQTSRAAVAWRLGWLAAYLATVAISVVLYGTGAPS